MMLKRLAFGLAAAMPTLALAQAHSINDWVTPSSWVSQPVNGWRYLAFERSQPHAPQYYHEMEYGNHATHGPVWQSGKDNACYFFVDGSGRIRSRTSAQFEAVREWIVPYDGTVYDHARPRRLQYQPGR